MALTTYSELQDSVADWLNRTDLTTQIVDFITLAETEISRWARFWWNEKRAYAVPTSAFIALPTDYVGMRNVQWNYSNYRIPLEQVSPELVDRYEMLTSEGLPQFYCVQDGQIELRPSPNSGNTTQIEISYYFKPAVLTDTNTTNELLENAPDLLLYACLMIGAKITLDDKRYALYSAEYQQAKRDLILDNAKFTWGQANSLRVRPG